MAKAIFHKNQRVYVKPVGTWAVIERVVPHWTKGLEEPLRITYDVGLGREFGAEELETGQDEREDIAGESWRVVRAQNRWQTVAETADHPVPGTYPVVMTGETDWGGWRVPAAEYALSPSRIETQARLLASAPRMAAVLRTLMTWAKAQPAPLPPEVADAVRQGGKALAYAEQGGEG
jgi:hypothetical protein